MATQKTLKIKDNPDYIKDLASGAVINTSTSAYEHRLAQIEKRKVDEQQSKDIIDMKNEIAELTKLVKKLVNK
jgi:benzoyl-CoA reductase/2-hydroxyglutaryl-CoA dehydratase subunit BcrC/BadD/HgdB